MNPRHASIRPTPEMIAAGAAALAKSVAADVGADAAILAIWEAMQTVESGSIVREFLHRAAMNEAMQFQRQMAAHRKAQHLQSLRTKRA